MCRNLIWVIWLPKNKIKQSNRKNTEDLMKEILSATKGTKCALCFSQGKFTWITRHDHEIAGFYKILAHVGYGHITSNQHKYIYTNCKWISSECERVIWFRSCCFGEADGGVVDRPHHVVSWWCKWRSGHAMLSAAPSLPVGVPISHSPTPI